MVIKMVNRILGALGWQISKKDKKQKMEPDMAADVAFMQAFNRVSPFTMTSPERLYALHKAVIYTIEKGLAGSFVECGVWRGGSSMMIALTLQQLGISDRDLYLYDTFEGMSEPTEADKDLSGDEAAKLLATHQKTAGVWAFAGLDDVQQNMTATGYPAHRIHYIKGKVEDTIPGTIPAEIALLRLDTDWYESTKHELVQLYPLLAQQGPLIIDDFGHWQGAKKAVVEYFEGKQVLMHRIDYTGRMIIK
jgi:hypothetical protein